jgi:hypothetical protein
MEKESQALAMVLVNRRKENKSLVIIDKNFLFETRCLQRIAFTVQTSFML